MWRHSRRNPETLVGTPNCLLMRIDPTLRLARVLPIGSAQSHNRTANFQTLILSRSQEFSRRRIYLLLLSLGIGLLTLPALKAATLYWDDNGATAGTTATPNGTWGIDNFWNASSAGTGGGGGPWFQNSDAVFSAAATATGVYTVGVTGTQIANSIVFNRGTPTLTGTAPVSLILGPGGLALTQGSSSGGVGGDVTLASSLGTITLAGDQNWANNITSAAVHGLTVGANLASSGVKTTTLNITSQASGGTTGTVFSGSLMDSSAGGRLALTINTASGVTTSFLGANTFTGSINMNSGTLRLGVTSLGVAGSFSSSSNLNFLNTSQFTYDNTNSVGSFTQRFSGLTVVNGGATILSSRVAAQPVSLTFDSFSRAAGTSVNFVTAGGVTGTDNKIVLTGQPTGFISQGAFSGTASGVLNNYAYYDANGFVRGINYGIDPNTALISTGSTDIGTVNGQFVETTGTITAQPDIAINTLQIQGANSFTMNAGATLTLSNGGLLKAGNNAATLSGGAGITTGGTAELIIRADQASDNLTISMPILATTTSGVTKAGLGTLNLAGGNVNVYSGTTTINAGTFNYTSSDIIPNTSDVLLNNTATMALGANTDTVGKFTLNGGTLTSSSSTGILTASSYDLRFGTVTAILTGTNGITKNGLGTVLLNPTNGPEQFAGPTTVNAGTLQINFTAASATNSISSSSPLVMGGGAIQPNTTVGSASNRQSFNGTSFLSGDSTVGASRAGASSSATVDLGAITLRNPGATVNYGTGTNITFTSAATNNAAGILGGFFTVNGVEWARISSGTTVAGGATYTSATNGTFTNATNTDMTADAGITGTTATLRFNTFNGSGPSITGTISGPVSVDTGGILMTINTLNTNGVIASTDPVNDSLTSGTNDLIVIQNNAAALLTINPNIINNAAGAVALTKSGVGTLILAGSNTFTGGIFINNGILQVGGSNALGSNGISFGSASGSGIFGPLGFSSPVLRLAGNSVTVPFLSTTNAYVGTPTVENGGLTPATLTVNTTGSNTFTGLLTDGTAGATLSLTKSGAGTFVLTGTNTFTGDTFVNGGTLLLASSQALRNSPLNTSGAGTTSFGRLSSAFLGGLKGANNLALTNANGAPLALTLGGISTSSTFTSVLSGSGSLTKVGTGTFSLNNANTFSGGTIVNGGTLRAGNSTGSATGTGGVTVNSGATLTGPGLISGLVTLSSGGHLAPGDNVGTLTVGSVTLSTGSILDYEFKSGVSDLLNVTSLNGLTINSGVGINVYAEGTTNKFTSNGTFNLFGFSGSLQGTGTNGLSVLNQQSGLTYTFGTSGTFVTLTISGAAALVSTWTADADGSWGTGSNWNNGIPNAVGDQANFLSAITQPRTVSLNGSRTVGTIVFSNTNSYTIAQGSSGSLILNNGAATAQVTDSLGNHTISAPVSLSGSSAIFTVTNSGDTLTASNVVSGIGSLTKNGSGTLALSAANTYSGGTILNLGVVQISTSQALGSGTTTYAGNSTLRSAADNLNLTNSIVLNNSVTGTIDTQGNTTIISGTISDTNANGSIAKSGSGTLVLLGSNSYAGNTTINSGTLQLGNGGTAGSVNGNIINNGALVVNRSDNLTLSGIISGLGTLLKQAGNVLTLAGTNTYTGNTVISNGTLAVATDLALQGSTVDYNNQGGTLVFTNGVTNATLGGLSGAQNLALVNDTGTALNLTVGANGQSTTYSGILSGSGSLIKSGGGELFLSGPNTFTGSTTINGGFLRVATTSALANTSAITDNSANGLRLNDQVVINAPISIGTGVGANSFVDVLDAGATATLAGNVTKPTNSAQYRLGVNGSGATLILTGSHNTGNSIITFITTGNIIFSGSSVLNSTTGITIGRSATALSLTLKDNASFLAPSASFGDNNAATTLPTDTLTIQDNATFNIGTGNFDLNNVTATTNTVTLNLNGGTLTAGSFTKSKTGVAQLTVFNFNGGTLVSSTSSASFIPSLAGLTLAVRAGGAKINDNGFAITIGNSLSHDASLGNTADGGLTKIGSGTLTLAGTNTYTGNTVILGGTLSLTNASGLAGSTLNYNNQGGVVAFTGITSGSFGGLKGSQSLNLANDLGAAVNLSVGGNNSSNTYSGVLSGIGSLDKVGTGALALTASNSYSGGTIIDAGILQINSNASLGLTSGTVTITSGTLEALNTITTSRNVVISGSAGSSPSTIQVDRSATYTITGRLSETAAGPSAFAKAGPGTLVLNGSNTFSGGLIVNGGTLLVDYSAGATLSSTNELTLGGGNLSLKGKAVGATTQVLGSSGPTLNTGGSTITLTPNGGTSTTLTLSPSWARQAGATLNVDLSAGTSTNAVLNSQPQDIITTGQTSTSDILPYATVKDASGVGFAAVVGTNTVRYTGAATLTTTSNDPTTNFTTTANGSTFNWNLGTDRAVKSLAINTATNNGTLDLGGNVLSIGSSVGGLLMTGTGNYTIQNGQVGANDVELVVHQYGTGTLTISGTVSGGAGSLTKTGTGTLSLAAVNNYSGATNVNAGTLIVQGSISSSPTTVNNNGILGGAGIVGTLDIKNAGLISPGVGGVGKLTTGAATLEAGGIYKLELKSDGSGTAGTNWDQVAASGLDLSKLTFNTPFIFQLQTLTAANANGSLTTWDPSSNHLWTSVVTNAGSLVGTFDTSLFTVDASGFVNSHPGTFSVIQDGTNLDLQYIAVAVPEPRTWAMMISGVGMLLVFNRRKKRSE